MRHLDVRVVGLLVVGSALAGCGLDELFVSVRKADGPPVSVKSDGGADDFDAGDLYLPDGATRYLPDGALREPLDIDASGGDGDGDGWLGDGGIDAGPHVIPLEGCTVDEDSVWRQTVPFADEGGHDLSPGGTGFGIAYRLDEGCDAVEASSLGSTGPFPQPVPVLGQDACAVFRDLSLLRDGDRWLLSWIDNSAGSAELHYRFLTADMTSPGDITRVTDNAFGEQKPTLARMADTTVLAWIEDRGTARAIRSTAPGQDEVHEILAPEAGHLPLKLAIAAMGSGDAAAVGWVNEQGDRGVWLQPLDALGAPVGSPTELTDLASAGSTVDLATRTRGASAQLGGAAVYSVIVENLNREIRFRRLDGSGQPIESERVLVGRPNRSQDASISEVGDGYVVAYRALPDGLSVQTPEIRLLFVTREGNVERDPLGRALTYKVADATATQGRTTVRASVEGQLLISWLDFDPASGENILKMTRRRLDCP